MTLSPESNPWKTRALITMATLPHVIFLVVSSFLAVFECVIVNLYFYLFSCFILIVICNNSECEWCVLSARDKSSNERAKYTRYSETQEERSKFPDAASYVGWICWFSSLLWEVFPLILRFFPTLKKLRLVRLICVNFNWQLVCFNAKWTWRLNKVSFLSFFPPQNRLIPECCRPGWISLKETAH